MFDQLRIGSDAKDAKEFTPVHPNPAIGKNHGISLLLHGKYSQQYLNGTAAMLRRAKRTAMTTEESIQESAKLIVTCCDGVGRRDRRRRQV